MAKKDEKDPVKPEQNALTAEAPKGPTASEIKVLGPRESAPEDASVPYFDKDGICYSKIKPEGYVVVKMQGTDHDGRQRWYLIDKKDCFVCITDHRHSNVEGRDGRVYKIPGQSLISKQHFPKIGQYNQPRIFIPFGGDPNKKIPNPDWDQAMARKLGPKYEVPKQVMRAVIVPGLSAR